jgi:putative addiction module killer protein
MIQIKRRVVDYYKTSSGKEPAKEWLSSIKDTLTQAILYKRIRQAGLGQFGKIRIVGDGVRELKIDYGTTEWRETNT